MGLGPNIPGVYWDRYYPWGHLVAETKYSAKKVGTITFLNHSFTYDVIELKAREPRRWFSGTLQGFDYVSRIYVLGHGWMSTQFTGGGDYSLPPASNPYSGIEEYFDVFRWPEHPRHPGGPAFVYNGHLINPILALDQRAYAALIPGLFGMFSERLFLKLYNDLTEEERILCGWDYPTKIWLSDVFVERKLYDSWVSLFRKRATIHSDKTITTEWILGFTIARLGNIHNYEDTRFEKGFAVDPGYANIMVAQRFIEWVHLRPFDFGSTSPGVSPAEWSVWTPSFEMWRRPSDRFFKNIYIHTASQFRGRSDEGFSGLAPLGQFAEIKLCFIPPYIPSFVEWDNGLPPLPGPDPGPDPGPERQIKTDPLFYGI